MGIPFVKHPVLARIGIDDDALVQAVTHHLLQSAPHLYVFSRSPYSPGRMVVYEPDPFGLEIFGSLVYGGIVDATELMLPIPIWRMNRLRPLSIRHYAFSTAFLPICWNIQATSSLLRMESEPIKDNPPLTENTLCEWQNSPWSCFRICGLLSLAISGLQWLTNHCNLLVCLPIRSDTV